MSLQLVDKSLQQTKALPNGANTVTSDGFQIHDGPVNGSFQANCEFVITCPALTTTELGDTQTITFTIEHDDASNFGSAAAISTAVVQTGAGGAGAAAASLRIRPNTAVKKYVRAKAVKTGASNASTASLTFEVRT